MRIAFFGGTFDPPHQGHLAIAQAALERLQLDQVLFAPVGCQPLKHNPDASCPPQASYEDRFNMVQLAIAPNPAFQLSLIDAPKPDGKPNYTIETLRLLKSTRPLNDELFCLIGADSFLTLRQWRSAAELLLTCDFIVAARPGFHLADLAASLPPSLTATLAISDANRLPSYQLFKIFNESGQTTTLYVLPDLDQDISATELRTALAKRALVEPVIRSSGKVAIAAMTQSIPLQVWDYIQSHGLYSAA